MAITDRDRFSGHIFSIEIPDRDSPTIHPRRVVGEVVPLNRFVRLVSEPHRATTRSLVVAEYVSFDVDAKRIHDEDGATAVAVDLRELPQQAFDALGVNGSGHEAFLDLDRFADSVDIERARDCVLLIATVFLEVGSATSLRSWAPRR